MNCYGIWLKSYFYKYKFCGIFRLVTSLAFFLLHVSNLFKTLGPGKLTSALSEWYFVQSQRGINVTRNLLQRSCSSGGSLKLSDVSEQEFWATVLLLVTQVRPVEACALLTSHPKANSNLFRDVRQLLIAMPLEESDQTAIESMLFLTI